MLDQLAPGQGVSGFLTMLGMLFIALVAGALFMIEGGLITDVIGVVIGGAVFIIQKLFNPKPGAMPDVRGMD